MSSFRVVEKLSYDVPKITKPTLPFKIFERVGRKKRVFRRLTKFIVIIGFQN